MSKKQETLNNVSYAFMEKAEISEEQARRLVIEHLAIKDSSIKTGYDTLLARQEKSLQVIKDHQEKQRAQEVERTKRMLLDENDLRKRNKPVYKPSFWHGVKQSELSRLAEKDAIGIVRQDEERRVVKVEKKFEEDRQLYLSDVVKELQRHTEQFNQSAENGGPRDPSQDRGGYDR